MAIDANGNIGERLKATLTATPSWATNTFTDTDADALKAFYDVAHYTYVNDAWTYTPPTNAELIQEAAIEQQALITAGLNTTLAGGFTSKTTGHTYVTTVTATWNGVPYHPPS